MSGILIKLSQISKSTASDLLMLRCLLRTRRVFRYRTHMRGMNHGSFSLVSIRLVGFC